MPDVQGSLVFLARSDRYTEEKPFVLRYNPVEGVSTQNLDRVVIPDLTIHDIRDLPAPPHFDENGVAVCLLESQMKYDDWFNQERVTSLFFAEVQHLLEEFFETQHVQIFEYRVSESQTQG